MDNNCKELFPIFALEFELLTILYLLPLLMALNQLTASVNIDIQYQKTNKGEE